MNPWPSSFPTATNRVFRVGRGFAPMTWAANCCAQASAFGTALRDTKQADTKQAGTEQTSEQAVAQKIFGE